MYGEATHRRHRHSTSATGGANNNINGEINKLKRKTKRVRRKRRGGGTGNTSPNTFLCCAACLAIILVGAWMKTLLGLQQSSSDKNGDGGKKESVAAGAANGEAKPALEHKLSEVKEKRGDSPTAPWEGWQLPISSKMETTWSTCIKEPNKYSSCRDLESDFGPAPPEPTNPWIPDVKMLRRMYLRGVDSDGNAWPPSLPQELCDRIGPNGGTMDTNQDLIDAVPILAQPMDRTEEEARAQGLSNGKTPPPNQPMPKIMCSLYTMASAHAGSIRAIRETWGGGCDGFLAFSTESDPRIPAISIPHDGPEEYNNMWQKIRSIWRFVGTHYIDDFDYFFIGGDDLFVLPQNLREYLWTIGDPDEDHYVGRRFLPAGPDSAFNSGGAGYALSRGTLRKVVEVMDVNPMCRPDAHTPQEDVMIAKCLRDIFGINYMDTRDAEDRERFHPFAPGHHLTWQPPQEGQEKDWYETYNREWGIKLGKDCCAPDSVSFHYIKKPTMVRHLSALLYTCGNKNGGGNLRKRPA